MNKPDNFVHDFEQNFQLEALANFLKLYFIFLDQTAAGSVAIETKEIFFQIPFLIMRFLLAQCGHGENSLCVQQVLLFLLRVETNRKVILILCSPERFLRLRCIRDKLFVLAPFVVTCLTQLFCVQSNFSLTRYNYA